MANLRYEMKKICLGGPYEDGTGKQIQDNDTEKIYRKCIDQFCFWLKDNYNINTRKQLEKWKDPKELIQEYEYVLEKEGKSASTIHTYIAPVCKGLGIHMEEIKKPKRTALEISKSRDSVDKNLEGKRDLHNKKYARLISFQEMTGLRRSELKELKVSDCFVKDESKYLCIRVVKGKGGKEQLQRVLPEDREKFYDFLRALKRTVIDCEVPWSEINLFTKEEMRNKIDLHGMRAEQARRAYSSYLKRCETQEGTAKIRNELVARWNAFHGEYDMIKVVNGKYIATSRRAKAFITELTANGQYILRGDNRERCMLLGRPLAYNRTALLAVSVFHLSHWRNDVTVKHYML